MKIKLLLLAVISIMIFGCKKEDNNQNNHQDEVDEQIILDYLSEHDIDATPTGTGLYYLIQREGTGEYPDINSTVKVYYKGYLTNGYVFDDGTATFTLNNLVQGWKEGIPLINKDGVIKLFIPSKLGYGSNAQAGIPANSVLIFEIHLIDFF